MKQQTLVSGGDQAGGEESRVCGKSLRLGGKSAGVCCGAGATSIQIHIPKPSLRQTSTAKFL